jgi:hypothetical protein
MIAPEKKKKHQQNNEGDRFEEGYPEQALILQQDAPPPGRKCRHSGARAAAKGDVNGEELRELTLS